MKIPPQALILLLILLMAACQPQSTTTAITNVTVIDAITGVRTNRTVVFSGDEITRVTAADVPAGAE
ncbi:MAG: hypothetical protein PVF63_10865, partial [Gammaproteobacteria bacterium]